MTATVRGLLPSPAARMALTGFAYLLAALLGIVLTRQGGDVAALWPANAILIGVLLRTAPSLWPGHIAVCLVANGAANLAMGDAMPVAVGFMAVNGLEVVCTMALVRRLMPWTPDASPLLTDPLKLVASGALGAAIGASAGAALIAAVHDAPFWSVWPGWWVADAIGMALIAPLLLSYSPRARRHLLRACAGETLLLAALTLGVALLVFRGGVHGAIYLVSPLLLWAGYRLGPFGCTLLGLLTTALVVGMTLNGLGPFVDGAVITPGDILELQLYLAAVILPALAVSIEREFRRHSERQMRQSAARYRRLYQQTPAMLYSIDRDGRIVSVSDRWLDVTGYTRAQVVGQRPVDFLTGESRRFALESAMPAFLRQGKCQNVPLQMRRRDGSLIEVRLSAIAEYDDAGELRRTLAVLDDVTERLRAERLLLQARRSAEQANRVKSAFLANMSHEIRTPLSAILGYADILASHLRDPDDLASVDTIRRNGRYLLEIINDVLDISKIEAGKLEVDSRPCDPVAVVGEVLSLMAVRARDKGLAFGVAYDGRLPATISTDPVRLRQILINLVGNAIKFTERGSVRLRVGLRRAGGAAGAQLYFAVTDTGLGISEPQLRRIFDAFHQSDMQAERRQGGTGLGLAISRQLATLLDGAIEVASTPGQGSTFTLALAVGDLRRVELVAPPPVHLPPLTPLQPLPSLAGRRLLIVDDRDDIRYLVQRLIERAGGEVLTAGAGAAALAAAAAERDAGRAVDAVVMDMQMPGMNGFEATRRLRRCGFERPIIALTAGAMLGEREKCLEAGCTAYLSKPVDGHRLIELLAAGDGRPVPAGHPGSAADRDAATVPDGAGACRVLVVDDSVDAATALARLLQQRGFAVSTAFDGASALAEADARQPDALVLDLQLPDIGGLEVMDRLRRRPALARTRFIGVSGESPTAESRSRFDHYLLKPVRLEELVALLEAG